MNPSESWYASRLPSRNYWIRGLIREDDRRKPLQFRKAAAPQILSDLK
jgi:hypothetical protein